MLYTQFKVILSVLSLCALLFAPATLHAQGAECVALETGTVTVFGSTTTIRPTETACGATGAQISAARNEFESFQIVVQAAGAQLNTVNVTAGALTGPGGATIAASNITIYREGLYTVTTPSDGEGATGEWPDALIPKVDPWYGETRNAFPVNVPAATNRVAWIDVFVPKSATPGAYTGTVTVSSAGGSVQVPVSLKILNATLPSTSTLQSSFSTSWSGPCNAHTGNLYCNWDETQRWSLHAIYAQAALDNRVTISNPMPMGVNAGPSAAQTAQFKTYILPMLRPADTAFHNQWAAPRLQGAEMTSLNLLWYCGTNCLTAWKNLAVTAPTFNDKVFLYCVDEPGGTVAMWDTCRTSRDNAAAAWPGLPLLVTATIQDITAAGMDTAIDILTPVVNRMHDKDYANSCCRGNQRSKYDAYMNLAGNRLWMYTSNMSFSSDDIPNQYWDGWPGYAIDQPASQSRAMGWLSFTYNTNGELYWETTKRLASAWTPSGLYEQGGNGDGTLFYPGTPAAIGGTKHIPVESIRLKRIRDGREDYEYLDLLAKAGKRADAVAIATQLFPSMYQTTVTQAALDAARASLIAKLEGVATPMTMYRLYHDGTKEHLYTTDLNEYTVLGTRGWIQEGIAYRMLTSGIYNGVATIPLFRLYHPGILQHHWTTDSNEALTLSGTSSWSHEGTVGYLLPTQVTGTTHLYRMALASPPSHLWTTDLNEYETLATRGWVKEGIVGYVLP